MKDLAILVDNKNDSTEAQDLLFSMGYKWRGLGEISKSYFYPRMNKYFIFMNKNEMDLKMAGYFAGSSRSYAESRFKEITLPELRDLVILKRNDPKDATHTDGHYNFYVGKDENYFFSSCDKAWRGTWKNVDILKPIEKPMKEYLRKNSNGTYSYIGMVRPEHVSDFMIEIPEGATKLVSHDYVHLPIMFVKPCADGYSYCYPKENWSNTILSNIKGRDILWSRHTHPEELPFIDDEPLQSLNDQYAEIEKVRQSQRTASETSNPTIKETLNQRQSQYGSFEDVAQTTEQLFQVIKGGASFVDFTESQRMALYMIFSKVARLSNGDCNHKDSWHDIAGYATLIDSELVSEKDMPF